MGLSLHISVHTDGLKTNIQIHNKSEYLKLRIQVMFHAAVFSSLLTKAKKVSCNSFHAMIGWVSAKEGDTRIWQKKQYSDSVTQRPVMALCRRHYCPIVVKQLREREVKLYIFPSTSHFNCLHFKSRVR